MNKIKTQQKEIFGHPIGLYVLFFTELWERFSFYGMRALLVLFLTASIASDNPGWGWEDSDAITLYKWYTTLVYLAAIPGGIIADRFLGQKKTVMLGGFLLCIGHGVLAIDAPWAFYTGLGFIIAGVGGLKPNISTMVGGLYKKGDDRRDKGFTIFYIGINIGAFLAGIIIGQLGEKINWHYGFGLAGIGMFLGQVIYVWGQKYLKGVGDFIGAKEATPEEKEAMKRPLTRIEKDRVKVLILSFLIVIVFWGAFEQAGGLMNLYAKSKTDRVFSEAIPFIGGWEVPASYFQSVNSFFIFTLGMLVAGIWYRRNRKGKEASSLFKMGVGVIIMGMGFIFMSFASSEFESTGSSGMYWLILAYLFHTIGELSTSPVSLSFITKLAPLKYSSLMMGAYFAASGMGNFVAGTIGEQIKNYSEMQLFTGITIFCVLFGLLIIALLKPLKRLTHGAEDLEIKTT